MANKPKTAVLVIDTMGGNLQSIVVKSLGNALSDILDIVKDDGYITDSGEGVDLNEDGVRKQFEFLAKKKGNTLRYAEVDGGYDLALINVNDVVLKPGTKLWH